MIVVGVAGKARSGKDSIGLHLEEQHGFKRVAFAAAMKDAALALDPLVSTCIDALEPFTRRHELRCRLEIENIHTRSGDTARLARLVDLLGWEDAKAIPDVRRLLQRFGTEMGRRQWGEDFWVHLAVRLNIDPTDHDQRVVFTDVRFDNEARAIHSLGGDVWQVVRPDGSDTTDETAVHASEIIDFKVDHTITNDGTLYDLHQAVERLLKGRL